MGDVIYLEDDTDDCSDKPKPEAATMTISDSDAMAFSEFVRETNMSAPIHLDLREIVAYNLVRAGPIIHHTAAGITVDAIIGDDVTVRGARTYDNTVRV